MSIFRKKQLTYTEQIVIARKKQKRALKKRDKLDKKYANNPFRDLDTNYTNNRNEINRTIAQAITDEQTARELAKEEAKHGPQYIDTSKRIVFAPQTDVNIGSNNKASAEAHVHLKKDIKKGSTKTSKVKLIFFGIVILLMLAGVIALTVHIHSCILDNKDSYSNTYYSIDF